MGDGHLRARGAVAQVSSPFVLTESGARNSRPGSRGFKSGSHCAIPPIETGRLSESLC